ncbi:oligosaccharide flippase family protein [Muricauda sp. JGD-17]|uniref:Oligosaccharide flippase family protein n=1 Tax=Flagellimonas ochracea TaxID=2696472 RepID=A0A964TBQ8_9FLAO|nr:flippase [Allomuricauda ochracea]NAY91236.1 oligosaccharide flippase family protein [Allomuricauda ochracea]
MFKILISALRKLGVPIQSDSSEKIVVNTGWLFFERMLSLLAGLFIGVWVTRYLGPDEFGLYSYVLSFSVLFTSLASFGIDQILVRDLVKFPSKKDELVSTGFIIKAFGAALTTILALIVVSIFDYEKEQTGIFILIVVGSTIFNCFSVVDLYLQSIIESKRIVKVNSAILILFYSLKIIFIVSEFPLSAFVLLIPLEGLIKGLGYLLVFRRNNHKIILSKFNFALSKDMINESWPLILSGFAISVGLRIDQIMLKEYVSLERLGIYSVGVRLAELSAFIPMALMKSFFPRLVSSVGNQNDDLIIKVIRFIFYFLCLIAFIVSIMSNFVIKILYGEEFMDSALILTILIWTIPLTFLGIITNKLLTIKKYQKTIFLKQISLTIVNIVLNLVLIPSYGIIGAAFATLIADLLINFFMDLFLKKARWIFYLKLSGLTKFK